MKILDIGAGEDRFKINPNDETITLDKIKLPNTDIVWDLEKTPLPFKDNEFDYIHANHVLEHILNLENLIKELYRITKNNGIIDIKVPWFSSCSAFSMIGHIRFFAYTTFDQYRPKKRFYTAGDVKFEIVKKHITFGINKSTALLNPIINPIVNAIPRFYQRFLCWIIPCEQIEFLLKVKK